MSLGILIGTIKYKNMDNNVILKAIDNYCY